MAARAGTDAKINVARARGAPDAVAGGFRLMPVFLPALKLTLTNVKHDIIQRRAVPARTQPGAIAVSIAAKTLAHSRETI